MEQQIKTYVGERSKRHTELAAVCDSLLHEEKWFEQICDRVLAALAIKQS